MTSSGSSSASDRVLLPANVRPTKYDITLQPDLKTFKVIGKEDVHVKINEATNTIVVHSNEIAINAVRVAINAGASASAGAQKKVVEAKSIDLDVKEERATFTFPEAIPVGEAVLSIDFTATLNDGMAGFYRSKYHTPSGEERYMATTQFESTDARKAFPCWDEPAVKAIFEVTLVVPVDRIALSNMLPVNETVNGDLKTVKFAPSPIMSTYLVAFVVGEFEYVEDRTKEGVLVRVYTPVGKKNLGTFGLSVATKTLSYFTEYFDIPYPLPKLDMVAIADFSAGAMENWGLVTYREIALLIDEKSAVSQKQRVAYVVAHELAHQWFGNLVTMEWWSQLWLNEGFATFVGNLATDFIFPEWDMWTLFVNDYQSTAFSLDSLKSSHPIEVEVRTSAEISEIFDAISYNKGSCVIRMLETFLGHDNFRKGLQIYLKRHAYSNAVTEDLWKALAEVSGQDVKEFMDAFTKAVNFPVVSVKQGSAANKLDVSQTRFLASGESTENDATAWHVALHIARGNSKEISKITFNKKSATVDVDAKSDGWIKVNSGQSGFYRVKYSDELLARLLPPLQSLTLPPVDRLGVQGDVFALAKAGFVPTSKALDIALALRNEVDYTVWASLASNLASLASVWMHEPINPQIQAFIVHLFEPIFAKLGWDAKTGESPSDTLLRSIVINRLGTNGHAGVIAEAKKRFQLSLTNPDSLSSDLKSTVYEIALLNGGQAEQDKLFELYKTATAAEDRVRILTVISLVRDEKLILKGLQFSLTDDVRDQDKFMVYAKLATVPDGGRVAWQFLQANWQPYIQKLSKSGSALLSRIIARSTEHFTTEAKAKEVEAFFKEHSFPAGDRVIKQSIETVHARAGWLNRGRDDVTKWFGSHKF